MCLQTSPSAHRLTFFSAFIFFSPLFFHNSPFISQFHPYQTMFLSNATAPIPSPAEHRDQPRNKWIKVEGGGYTSFTVLDSIKQPLNQSLLDMAQGLRYRHNGQFIRPVMKSLPPALTRRLPHCFTDPGTPPLRSFAPTLNWSAWRQPPPAPAYHIVRPRQSPPFRRTRSSPMKTRSLGKGLQWKKM